MSIDCKGGGGRNELLQLTVRKHSEICQLTERVEDVKFSDWSQGEINQDICQSPTSEKNVKFDDH